MRIWCASRCTCPWESAFSFQQLVRNTHTHTHNWLLYTLLAHAHRGIIKSTSFYTQSQLILTVCKQHKNYECILYIFFSRKANNLSIGTIVEYLNVIINWVLSHFKTFIMFIWIWLCFPFVKSDVNHTTNNTKQQTQANTRTYHNSNGDNNPDLDTCWWKKTSYIARSHNHAHSN